jgi:enoyl-CoA hydratase
MGGDVLVEQTSPDVATVTLNRPERRNALSWEMMDQIHEVLDDLERDNRTRVVVLTGADRGFCSGLDLKSAGALTSSVSEGLRGPAAGLRSQEHMAEMMIRLRRIPQPVVAAVNGDALGGGLALALFSDIRVAAESARFGTQFIKVGLSGCDAGVSYALPRLIGASRAFELMLTGRMIDAAEAERIGLVSRVVPDAEVLDVALAVADEIIRHAPFGVTMTKEVMWSNLSAPSLEAAIHLENRTQILASHSGDFQEALAAFPEKRPPDFSRAP